MKLKLVPSQATHHMIARAMHVRRDLERMGNSSDYQQIHIMWHEMSCSAPPPPKLSDGRIFEIATRFQDGGDFGWDTNMCEREQLGFARAIEREILGENNDSN